MMEDNKPKVSIITVCRNSEKTIERTIKSVLDQTYDNIEYIIIDGASSDHTMDIVRSYEKKSGCRMRYISEKDDGIYYAMNKGIDMSSGDLIGIINSDDFYESAAVETVVKNYDPQIRYQILYGETRSLKDGREESVSIGSSEFIPERMISHPACFITKDVYKDLGKYDTKYISAADYDFMLRMYYSKKVEFKEIYAIIVNFSLGGMCGSDAAYLDLLNLQKNYGKISDGRYRWLIFKNRMYSLLVHHKMIRFKTGD